jgi:hypothetical protein
MIDGISGYGMMPVLLPSSALYFRPFSTTQRKPRLAVVHSWRWEVLSQYVEMMMGVSRLNWRSFQELLVELQSFKIMQSPL